MPAEPERLTYVLTIDCDHLGERTANAAYILTLKVSYDCRPAPQHVMSWHLGQIGREAARVAGAPMTVAYGPADHAYEVAASAEGPVGRGGRSRPIASFGLFHAITVEGKGLRGVSERISNFFRRQRKEWLTRPLSPPKESPLRPAISPSM